MGINVTLNAVGDLTNTVTAQSTINTNSNTITTALTSALNNTGDKMLGVLDMNSNAIINLPTPVSGQSPVRLVDITTSSTISLALPSITGVVTASATAGQSVTVFSGTGNLPVSQLAGGANATANTFWSGAGTWSAPATTASAVTAGTGIAVSLAGTTYTVSVTTPVPIVATNDTNVTAVISTSTGTLTMGWTGILAQSRGGIGTAPTASAGAIIYSVSTAYLPNTAATATNFVLLSGIAGTGAPVWANPVPIAAGGLGTVSGAFVRSKVQVFTASSATYTPSAGLLFAIVECVAGGGGGGGSACTNANNIFAGGGGGSGAYSRKYLASSVIGGSQTVTVGLGGTGAVGTTAASVAGGTGGTTGFGTLCVSFGGFGGLTANGATGGLGGNGGTTGSATGDVVAAGACAQSGVYFFNSSGLNIAVLFPSGAGAPSYFGGGAAGVSVASSTANGNNGNNYGSGGSGGMSSQIGTATAPAVANGGSGSPGICVVTEFCNT